MSILGKSNRDRVYLSRKFALDAKLVKDSFVLHIDELSLNRLPEDRGCILLCNRPIGAIEELLINSLLPKFLSKETAFYNNPFLSSNEGIRDKMILTNDDRSTEDIAQLQNRVNVIFPVGVLSKRRNHKRAKVDGRWNRQTIRHIMALGLPIYPVLLEARIATAGRVLSSFHSVHRTTQILVSALQEEKNDVTVHIGRPIDQKQLQLCSSEGQLTRLLRSKVFSLGTPIHVDDYFFNEKLTKGPLANPVRQDVLLEEKKALDEDHLLFESGGYAVYLFYALDAPNWIQEIGRLRALNERLTGRGISQPRCLDELDLYHEHIVLWSTEEKQIIASCRVGDGKRVFATHGKSGLSLDQAFHLNPAFDSLLKKSIDVDCFYLEHGSSKDDVLLSLLWSGIAVMLHDRPYLRYLSSLSSLRLEEVNNRVPNVINTFISERKHDALASYIKPKNSKLITEVSSQSMTEEGRDIASMKGHPICLPAPAQIAHAIWQHAKVLSITADEKNSSEIKALIWMEIQDFPPKWIDQAGGLREQTQ